MRYLLTSLLCVFTLSLTAQDDCPNPFANNGEIVNSPTFSLLGSFDSKQYYISDNPINISDNFYGEFNALANSYGGNLLSINSFEENDFIYDSFVNQFSSSSYYYIGLFNTAPSNLCCGQGDPPGVWEWMSGENVVYTNWDINNNQPSGDELHASGSVSLGGLWIDVSGGHSGHIILEIDLCVLFISGCMDSNACNYNPDAAEDDGNCDYSCCPGPGCCNDGTYWDDVTQTCLLDITFCSWQPDSNADGNIGIGDLLDLLSVFGDTDYDEDGVFDSVDDCVDPTACNYQSNPTEPCYYIDVLGICGGGCEADEDGDAICDDIDDCIGVVDECGVCNGPGPTEVVIESITILYDSVYAEAIDNWFVFEIGADTVFNYFCEPVFTGCGDLIAHEGHNYSTVQIGDQCWFSENCRYLPEVSPSSASSETDPYYYVYDYDGTDVAAAQATENYATYGVLYNWPAVMTEGICPSGWHIPSEGEFTQLTDFLGGEYGAGYQMKSTSGWNNEGYNGSNSSGFNALPSGLKTANNFIWLGNWGGILSSSEGGILQINESENTNFSYTLTNQGYAARCIIDYTDDCGVLNGDNSTCLDECGVPNGDNSTCFTNCGDDIGHEGYDYSTVLIGEQCWFAENCRYLPEVSPSNEGNTTDPYYYVYGYEGTDVASAMSTSNYATYGVLYNWPAVMTEGICPSGWHIPSDGEWQTMEISLGMSEADAASEGWRGSPVGDYMKSTSGWNSGGNGSNSSGFTGLPGGYRSVSSGFIYTGIIGGWWSASEFADSEISWRRRLSDGNDTVLRGNSVRYVGFSARCVRD